MASCHICAAYTMTRDPVLRLPFCGSSCQKVHYLALVAGKRKLEDGQDGKSLCDKDTVDPFTQDSFSDMDERAIIKIGPDCFHLPSL
jgi:endogenous inhibitor of DNA gyrase (YacG/DUF329 family)